MIREWQTEVFINGKKYRVYHAEWPGYGGSRMKSSRMEIIENEIQDNIENIDRKTKERALDKKER